MRLRLPPPDRLPPRLRHLRHREIADGRARAAGSCCSCESGRCVARTRSGSRSDSGSGSSPSVRFLVVLSVFVWLRALS
jgi:hypothetical protein